MNGEDEQKNLIASDAEADSAVETFSDDDCTGYYSHVVDEKYRIKIPVEARAQLKGPIRLCVSSLGQAITIYSKNGAQKMLDNLKKQRAVVNADPNKSPEAKRKAIASINRTFTYCTPVIEEDSQGRFVLPQALMKYAGIAKKCAVCTVGVGGHFELWNAATYEATFNDDNYREGLEEAGVFGVD